MTWNYRIAKIREYEFSGDQYGVVEAYYEDGELGGWTCAAVPILADDLDQLRTFLQQALDACDQPVLDDLTEDCAEEEGT